MSKLNKVRALAALMVLAAALAVLLVLPSYDRGAQPVDPLALCATTKGALCERSQAEEIDREAIRNATTAVLGEITVSARRESAAPVASTAADASLLGTMTVTASRLPRAALARAKSVPGAQTY